MAEKRPTDSRREGIEYLLKTLVCGKTQVLNQLTEIDIVAHRVVHGGQEYRLRSFIGAMLATLGGIDALNSLHDGGIATG